MAVRSGAGTGVIVSLVVFVLTTVFLLILSIVFYAGRAEAEENLGRAQDDLAKFVKPQERNNDVFKTIEQSAAASGQSVAFFLNKKHRDLLGYLNGDATVAIEQLKADLARYGVVEDGVVRHTLEENRREIRNAETQLEGLRDTVATRDAELAEKQAQLDQMKKDHANELAEVSAEIHAYRDAAEQYRDELRETIDKMNARVERAEDQHRDRIAEVQAELDSTSQELVLLLSRVDEYEALFNNMRIKAKDPALLVDGTVIDVESANEQVYIDRGRRDRIVLGMTFEIYDDFSAIRVNPRTGVLPRGKASLQVVKVDETTSTCKLTRTVPGRPVVRGNVLANAIYDPSYVFKFLIHGKFDVDGDGRPSEAEAEYLRSRVIDWGGEVVIGTELPGDLDFLVLGEMPPMPAPLRPDANAVQEQLYLDQRVARLTYEALFQRASDAQIPVLNDNRFMVLIGHTSR